MAIKTFAELEKEEKPSASSVLETLEDYASGGWAIVPRVVLGVIHNAGLNREELKKAREYLQIGYDIQNNRSEEKAAREYEEAREGIDRLLK